MTLKETIMKIPRCSSPRMSKIYLRPSPVRRGNISTFRSAKAKRDEVHPPPRVDELRKLTGLAKDIPDMRQDKIETIRKQIKSGTYKVSAKSVAESIVDLHRTIYSDTE